MRAIVVDGDMSYNDKSISFKELAEAKKALSKNKQLASELSLSGTPTIFDSSLNKVGPNELLKKLNSKKEAK